MAATTPETALGTPAPDFRLPAIDGRRLMLADVAGPRGTVIAFICNHCPYVIAVIDRLVEDARALLAEGIGVAAICSNDAERYPEDDFDRMRLFAEAHGFPFPYLWDETQGIARTYGAVCTPDFFGYDANGLLAYRGRLDAGRLEPPPVGSARELREAMLAIARGAVAPQPQHPSMGCSIKWRQN